MACSTVMECAQKHDAQALAQTCAQNKCAQESLLFYLAGYAPFFTSSLFYQLLAFTGSILFPYSGSMFASLAVCIKFMRVESGRAGASGHMRANRVRAGKCVLLPTCLLL